MTTVGGGPGRAGRRLIDSQAAVCYAGGRGSVGWGGNWLAGWRKIRGMNGRLAVFG